MPVDTPITEDDVKAYFVWIPRYRYQLFNVEGETIDPLEIQIEFESSDKTKSTGKQNGVYTNGQWLTHPAFTFGNEELNGIWVGKFNSSEGKNDVASVLPNKNSFTGKKVSDLFTSAQTISLGASMMKNSEWGMTAYLSHSKYGINGEIRRNNYSWSRYQTGCGASEENQNTDVNVCEIEYGKSDSYPQSTTGNINGIFDMNGGAHEYMMAVLSDPNHNVWSGHDDEGNSGYNGIIIKDWKFQIKTDGIEFSEDKYIDLYNTEELISIGSSSKKIYANLKKACDGHVCLGDATVETEGWYSKYSNEFVDSYFPWVRRRGNTFDYYKWDGSGNSNISFRAVWR